VVQDLNYRGRELDGENMRLVEEFFMKFEYLSELGDWDGNVCKLSWLKFFSSNSNTVKGGDVTTFRDLWH
jgi:hypothetical protein